MGNTGHVQSMKNGKWQIRIIYTKNVLLLVVIDFLMLNVCSPCITVAVKRHVTPRIIFHCYSAVLHLLFISHERTSLVSKVLKKNPQRLPVKTGLFFVGE